MKLNSYSFSLLLGFLMLCSTQATSQTTFRNGNHLLQDGRYRSGIAIAVADMNGDGYDDLIHLNEGTNLNIEYQQSDGSTFVNQNIGNVSNRNQWTMCIGDVDNDGYNDILTGDSYEAVRISMAEDFGSTFSTYELPGPDLFAQGSNMVDINNDGWLDVFVCHDDAESRIWRNDQNGNLLEADEWIDMRTTPQSDNSGNYGSIWTDFDNDGDLDLYIAKCRQGVFDPNNPVRINALFVNDGQGNYTDRAAEFGLRIGAQSWTADFQDIDNDGDLDCFITNHDVSSQILLNDGTGRYTDISQEAGVISMEEPLQGVMRDFDNDGFVDILVAGDGSYYYHNNGDRTFTEVGTTDAFDANIIHTYAIGDLNHDGFLDVVASYGSGFNSPSSFTDDVVWLNEGNENNYLVVNLLGDQSNRNGVGSRVEIYGDWGMQIREVRSGESYGIHNTFSQHFGLATATSVDSLVIRWPSGTVDKFTDLAANQFIQVNENGCISPNSSLSLSGSTTFCPGDSLIITAPDNLTYNWSTGAESQSIVVFNSGVYNVTVSDGSSCEGVSVSVQVLVGVDEIPTISTPADTINCPGTTITLTSSESSSYQWSNGAMTQSIEVSGAGTYTVEVQGNCGLVSSDAFVLEEYLTNPPMVQNDTVISMGSGTLRATGDSIQWYDNETGGNLLATGPEFVTPELNQTTTYWVEEYETFQEAPAFGGKTEIGSGGYTYENFQGLSLELREEVILRSALVRAEQAGMREIGFFNRENNEFLGRVNVMIPAGDSRVIFDITLPASSDISMFINTDAGLFYDDAAVTDLDFPYALGDFGQVNSSLNSLNYYYFYDLQVEPTKKVVCVSDRVPVDLVVEFEVAVKDLSTTDAIQLFPNPSNGDLQVQYDLPTEGRLEIYNVQGQLVGQRILAPTSSERLDLTTWPRGLFWFKVYSAQDTYLAKVVLQ